MNLGQLTKKEILFGKPQYKQILSKWRLERKKKLFRRTEFPGRNVECDQMVTCVRNLMQRDGEKASELINFGNEWSL